MIFVRAVLLQRRPNLQRPRKLRHESGASEFVIPEGTGKAPTVAQCPLSACLCANTIIPLEPETGLPKGVSALLLGVAHCRKDLRSTGSDNSSLEIIQVTKEIGHVVFLNVVLPILFLQLFDHTGTKTAVERHHLFELSQSRPRHGASLSGHSLPLLVTRG